MAGLIQWSRDAAEDAVDVRALAGVLEGELARAVERVPALIDRNPADPLCGSFDREYWAWNFKDYPNLSLQYGVLTMALLWDTPFAGNALYRSPDALRALEHALGFWARNQKPNGSFDQCYYNEQSYGTTSYTLIAVLRALDIAGEALRPGVAEALDQAIERAGRFLLEHAETYGEIANHQAQFLYALLLLRRRAPGAELDARIEEVGGLLEGLQSPEGWFREYDGMDAGYLTQTIYYLALAEELAGDGRYRAMAERAVEFIGCLVHPDGSCGSAVGARYNALFYTAGFVRLGPESAGARAVLAGVLRAGNPALGLGPLDPENLLRLAANHLEALRGLDKVPDRAGALPWTRSDLRAVFPEAGLAVLADARVHLAVSSARGGAMAVYDKAARRPLLHDPGSLLRLADGTLAGNGVAQRGAMAVDGAGVEIQAALHKVSIPLYTPLRGLVIRLLGLTALRSVRVNDWFKKLLVRYLVTGRGRVLGSFTRTVRLTGAGVEVEDAMRLRRGVIADVLLDPEARTRKMGSAGYALIPSADGAVVELDGAEARVRRTLKAG